LDDDLKATSTKGVRLRVAASTFSIFAFDALKAALANIEGLNFIITSPTVIPESAVDLFKELAKYKPVRIVFRDNGFESDAVKINMEQIFRQLPPQPR
jgi:hypothetical protein